MGRSQIAQGAPIPFPFEVRSGLHLGRFPMRMARRASARSAISFGPLIATVHQDTSPISEEASPIVKPSEALFREFGAHSVTYAGESTVTGRETSCSLWREIDRGRKTYQKDAGARIVQSAQARRDLVHLTDQRGRCSFRIVFQEPHALRQDSDALVPLLEGPLRLPDS